MLYGGDAMTKSHIRTYCMMVLLNAFAELCLLITVYFTLKQHLCCLVEHTTLLH